jgi:CheY-like chemotaxis protein
LGSTGKWKDEAEIRTALRETNPVLSRSRILGANSGRYSDLLIVSKSHVNANNPTGMIRPLGVPLRNIRWPALKEMVTGATGPANAITAVIFVRGGDAKCFAAERVAEIVNIDIAGWEPGNGGKLCSAEGGSWSGSYSFQENMKRVLTKGLRLFRMDVGDNNDAVAELGIKHLPTFVMYQGRNLAYCGVVGGQKLKISSVCNRPQILLVESDARMQISIEKVLKRYSCDVFLCLSISEAVERVAQFSNSQDDRTRIIFDLVLISEELQGTELSVLCKNLSQFVNDKRTIIAGLVSVLGPTGSAALRAVQWEDAFTLNVAAVVRKPLADCLAAAVQKPLKPAALQRLLNMRVVPSADENFGLTPESLVQLVAQVQSSGQPGSAPVMGSAFDNNGASGSGTYVGIRLSAEDTKMRGRALVSKR